MKKKDQRKKAQKLWFLDPVEDFDAVELEHLKTALKDGMENIKLDRQENPPTEASLISFSKMTRASEGLLQLYPYLRMNFPAEYLDEISFFHGLSSVPLFQWDLLSRYEKMEEYSLQSTAVYLLELLAKNDVFMEALSRCKEDEEYCFLDEHYSLSNRNINRMISVLRRNPKDKEAKEAFRLMLELLDPNQVDGLLRKYHGNWVNAVVSAVSAYHRKYQETKQRIKEELGFDPEEVICSAFMEYLKERDGDNLDPVGFRERSRKRQDAVDALDRIDAEVHHPDFYVFQLLSIVSQEESSTPDSFPLFEHYLEHVVPMTLEEFYAAEYFIQYHGLPYKDISITKSILLAQAEGLRGERLLVHNPWSYGGKQHEVIGLDEVRLPCDVTYVDYLGELEEAEPSEEGYGKWLEESGKKKKVVKLTRRQMLNSLGWTFLPQRMYVNGGNYHFLRSLGYDQEEAENLAVLAELIDSPDPNEDWDSDSSEEEAVTEELPKEEPAGALPVLQQEDSVTKKELDKKEKEIHRLRHLLTQKEKAMESLLLEMEEQKKELEVLKEHLLSPLEDEESVGTEENAEFQFPMELEENIVVFGGRSNFRTNLKRRLPTLRFYDSVNVDFDAIIKEADYVFLQSNAMSHSQYHKVMDSLKKLGKPFAFFHTSSSRTAAELIVSKVKGSGN